MTENKASEITAADVLLALNRDRKNRLKGVVTFGPSEILRLLAESEGGNFSESFYRYLNGESNRIKRDAESEIDRP